MCKIRYSSRIHSRKPIFKKVSDLLIDVLLKYFYIFFRIFRQRLSLFESFISKVDSVNSVNCIRKNILIQLKLSENRAFSKNSNVIPKEYSDYAKYNTLLNHLQSLRETNNDVGQQEKRRLDIIKTNGM